MKKKLLLILVAILVLVVGVFGYLAVNANSIIAKYKPEIEQKISVSLGSKVSLGDLSVSIFPSVKVGVNELTVAEAKAGDKFSLKNITANVGLLDLLSGKVNVKSLSIDKPSITLLKSGDKITIAGLPEKNDGSNTPRASHNGKSTASSAAGTSVSPVNIDLNSLSINSANINIKDANSGNPNVGLTINAAIL